MFRCSRTWTLSVSSRPPEQDLPRQTREQPPRLLQLPGRHHPSHRPPRALPRRTAADRLPRRPPPYLLPHPPPPPRRGRLLLFHPPRQFPQRWHPIGRRVCLSALTGRPCASSIPRWARTFRKPPRHRPRHVPRRWWGKRRICLRHPRPFPPPLVLPPRNPPSPNPFHSYRIPSGSSAFPRLRARWLPAATAVCARSAPMWFPVRATR